MQILNLIESKISEGKTILQELDTMRERSGMAMNVTYYVNEDVEKCRKAINKWQLTSKEVLISVFGETHRYVASFERTRTGKNVGFNYKREFLSEVNDGLCVLEAVQESVNVGLKGSEAYPEIKENKPHLLFISHSSKDREFVEALVDLLESMGFDTTNLFCSSIDGYGIGLSKDIFETLRNLFDKYQLYVIFIHSPHYYDSPISLNEMGAAWVLKTDFCSFLTTNMDFTGLKGVVNGSTISIKVDNADAPARLTELKDHLLPLFGLKEMDNIKWDRKRKAFLETVTTIKYATGIATLPETVK